MLKGKSFMDQTNLFSPNEYEKNDKIILKFFLNMIGSKYGLRKHNSKIYVEKYRRNKKLIH